MPNLSDKTKNLFEIALLVILVSGAVWTLMESRGDNRWAAREKTEAALTNLTLLAQRAQDHTEDKTVHMPRTEKDRIYVPRAEIDVRLNNIEADVKDVRETNKELAQEVRESRRQVEGMFNDLRTLLMEHRQ